MQAFNSISCNSHLSINNHMMRAKLVVLAVLPLLGTAGETLNEKVTFMAVGPKTGYPNEGTDENNTYALWTPSANLEMTINNPALFGKIKEGQEFYVDFTLADLVAGQAPVDPIDFAIIENKSLHKELDSSLQKLKGSARKSRHRSLAITHLEDSIMRLGMDMKEINEEKPGSAPNPYPQSYNPTNTQVEPTADGLKL